MKLRDFISFIAVVALLTSCCNTEERTPQQDRELWVRYLVKVADPVLRNTAEGTLKVNMPYEAHPDIMENSVYLTLSF